MKKSFYHVFFFFWRPETESTFCCFQAVQLLCVVLYCACSCHSLSWFTCHRIDLSKYPIPLQENGARIWILNAGVPLTQIRLQFLSVSSCLFVLEARGGWLLWSRKDIYSAIKHEKQYPSRLCLGILSRVSMLCGSCWLAKLHTLPLPHWTSLVWSRNWFWVWHFLSVLCIDMIMNTTA